jgi:hypothetical protein
MPPAHDAVIANLARSIHSKEAQYKVDIKRNHQLSRTSVQRVVPDDNGSLERVLLMQAAAEEGVVSVEEVQEFVAEQRQRLLALAADNDQDERTVDRFIAAMQNISQMQEADSAAEGDGDFDYEVKIRKIMAESDGRGPLPKESYYREISTQLDLSAENNDTTANDDDGIEVVRGAGIHIPSKRLSTICALRKSAPSMVVPTVN